ncbi:hypothetical protein SASPL_127124 [Salvia splendens]|uniref:RNase H type-1 domain-containing protein n=1 Tax=Salvia splendens TaxID=180675 RepID=A0A8X8ZRF8_SALSN|nr:hypothetical protein SASPL_127124 [Salvia splendens]
MTHQHQRTLKVLQLPSRQKENQRITKKEERVSKSDQPNTGHRWSSRMAKRGPGAPTLCPSRPSQKRGQLGRKSNSTPSRRKRLRCSMARGGNRPRPSGRASLPRKAVKEFWLDNSWDEAQVKATLLPLGSSNDIVEKILGVSIDGEAVFNSGIVIERIQNYLQWAVSARKLDAKQWKGSTPNVKFNFPQSRPDKTPCTAIIRWQLLQPNWIKLNTKGAFSDANFPTGGGGIIRDEHRRILGVFADFFNASSGVIVELLALLRGMNMARRVGRNI